MKGMDLQLGGPHLLMKPVSDGRSNLFVVRFHGQTLLLQQPHLETEQAGPAASEHHVQNKI
jgi:hypothetical protein